MSFMSLLSTKRKYKAYLFLLSVPMYFYHSLATKDYWTMLFISCLALFAPVLWSALGLFVTYKLLSCINASSINQRQIAQDVFLKSLLKNNLVELSMAIEANPEILYCDCYRKSLESWCLYYNNTRAQELVVELKIRYPRNSMQKKHAA